MSYDNLIYTLYPGDSDCPRDCVYIIDSDCFFADGYQFRKRRLFVLMSGYFAAISA